MAEQDQDRSEAATPFKLQEARKKGSVPKSMDLNALAILSAAAAVIYLAGGAIVQREMHIFGGIFANAHQTNWGSHAWLSTMLGLLKQSLYALAPLFGMLVAVAVLVSFLQTGPVFSLHPVKPDVQRINPVAGFKRLFSLKLIIESIKTVLKFALLGSVLYFTVDGLLPSYMKSMNSTPQAVAHHYLPKVSSVLFKLLAALAVVAVIDTVWSRWDFGRQMRMSRREIKDEHKRREGDPRIKSRLRELQREARKRTQSLSRVKDADVLITNPTRLAIAIKYDREEFDAPMVIAKGAGSLAMTMRRICRDHGVPMVENKALARQLFRQVRIDDAVPHEHFGHMAKILVWAYALRRRHEARGAA